MVQQTIQSRGYVRKYSLSIQTLLTRVAATRKPDAHRENQKQAVSQYADTRDMEGGLTGETVMPRWATWHSDWELC